LFTVINIII